MHRAVQGPQAEQSRKLQTTALVTEDLLGLRGSAAPGAWSGDLLKVQVAVLQAALQMLPTGMCTGAAGARSMLSIMQAMRTMLGVTSLVPPPDPGMTAGVMARPNTVAQSSAGRVHRGPGVLPARMAIPQSDPRPGLRPPDPHLAAAGPTVMVRF